jgi:hypothetical protein
MGQERHDFLRRHRITAELAKPIVMQHYLGHWDDRGPVCNCYEVPSGTPVRVTMASRFGDVGITDRIEKPNGCGARVTCAPGNSGYLRYIHIEPIGDL